MSTRGLTFAEFVFVSPFTHLLPPPVKSSTFNATPPSPQAKTPPLATLPWPAGVTRGPRTAAETANDLAGVGRLGGAGAAAVARMVAGLVGGRADPHTHTQHHPIPRPRNSHPTGSGHRGPGQLLRIKGWPTQTGSQA